MMKEKLIKTMDLENNLQLQFFDASRKLAGDRWLVFLIIRMEIPVPEEVHPGGRHAGENGADARQILGEKVVFEQTRKRIFVDEGEKENILEELIDRFQKSTLRYISREIFPKQYLLKLYREEKEKQHWYPARPE